MAEPAKYLLGLDAGNTVIKAVLFDLSGRQIALCALDGQSSAPASGYVERDLNELWDNAQNAIRRCIDEAGIAPGQIIGIGCAGHGNGLYLLDRAGAPLLGIQSLDARAADLAGELSAGAGEALHQLCLQKPWPSQTPTLLAWIKRHEPETYAKTGTVMLCKDFITYQLTGRRVSDISDMSGCGLTRMPECTYDGGLLALYGLSDAKDKLPDLLDPAEIVGGVTQEAAAVTGLLAGTPVITGFFDVISSALGSGVVSPGEASIIAGTWSINQVFSDAPVHDDRVFMVAGFGPQRFVNIESSATSAANLEWYVREFVERGAHHDDPFGFCNDRLGEVGPQLDDPFFHPFLYGSRLGPSDRAGFYGLAGWHGEGHMLRALFEGVMFEHKRHISVLQSAGVSFDRTVLSGGGARSPHWPQMFADCLGVPITVAQARETGALGAAIGAGLAVEEFADYEAGILAMTRPAREYSPDPSRRVFYDKRYAAWSELSERMREFWSTLDEPN
ncbi:FGGY-family carbohydrate kinase [Sedimentitalea sp.]|uniref:FGGY-family carbohydrate kinase n=1 Tax=Sedimentitalea sp. TaxID=2048915 RepID=UPI00329A14CA